MYIKVKKNLFYCELYCREKAVFMVQLTIIDNIFDGLYIDCVHNLFMK